MESLRTYINHVQEYFALLEKQVSKAEELLKKAEKPCGSIKNQCLILQSAVKKNSFEGTGLEKFPEFAQLLTNSVSGSVNKEIEALLYIRDEVSILGKELYAKWKSVEESFCEVQQRNLVQSSLLNPICPRLEHITDWCLDVWRYYHSLHLRISLSLEHLVLENDESVNAVTESFTEDKNLKEEINRIRSYEFQKFQFLE